MTYRSMTRPGLVTAAAAGIAGVVTLALACAEPSAPRDVARRQSATPAAPSASVGDQLGHLRSVLARYHDIEAARDAGYSIQLTGCMTDPARGGMGFHYGNGSLIDATADALAPEVLLYEPQKNGRYRLVGVEFIIPYTLRPRSGPAPTLFGQTFKQNDGFQLWALHAWIWRHNPAGMFEDWNPKVDCDAVPAAARMSHGVR